MSLQTPIMEIDEVLLLLVISSQEIERANLARQTLENLKKLLGEISIDLLVFDNGSKIKNYKKSFPKNAKLVESPNNLGYWSAIYWVLNQKSIIKRYIYIIESDLIHLSLQELKEIKRFLDENPEINCVRTQEFSVRLKWKFNKKLKFLPFHNTRSEISLRNIATGRKARFKRVDGFKGIYKSNLHPKLPAFHRWESLRIQFEKLREMKNFSEADYFKIATKESSYIGIHDPGLYYSLSTRENASKIPAASYLEKSDSDGNYKSTREGTILLYPEEDIVISR